MAQTLEIRPEGLTSNEYNLSVAETPQKLLTEGLDQKESEIPQIQNENIINQNQCLKNKDRTLQLNPEQAKLTLYPYKASILREQLKSYFKDRHAIIDQVYAEFYQFWMQVSGSQNSSDSDSSQISSFEVLIEKLKAKLSDQDVIAFFTQMITNDQEYRNSTKQLFQFSQEVINSDIELQYQKPLPAIAKSSMLSYEDINTTFKDAQWIVITTPYNIINNNISSLTEQMIEPPPQKRYAHSACIIGNQMFIFGGLNSPSKGGNLQTLYSCTLNLSPSYIDIETQKLIPLYQWDKVKAEAPKARDSHTCVPFQESLILFGGCGTGRDQSFGDLNKFCTKNKCWTRLEVFGETPPAREAHICQVIGDLLIIHGGLNQDEDSFDDIWVLVGLGRKVDKLQAEMSISNIQNQNAFQQYQLQQQQQSYVPAMALQFNLRNNRLGQSNLNEVSNQNEFLRWIKCESIGEVPDARDSHSSCLVNDKIYIYGGQGRGEVFFNDLYCVRIIEKPSKYIAIWQKVIFNGPDQPCPRTSHTCVTYKNRYLIVIGGETETSDTLQNQVDEKSSISSEEIQEKILDVNDTQLAKGKYDRRMSHNEQSISSSEESQKEPLSDVWIFDTFLRIWTQINPSLKIQGSMSGKKIKKQFEPRLAHTSVIFDQYVIVFGGLNSKKNSLLSNDIYVLCLDNFTDRILPPNSIDKKNSYQRKRNKQFQHQNQLPNLEKNLSIPSVKERAVKSDNVINGILLIANGEQSLQQVEKLVEKRKQLADAQVQTVSFSHVLQPKNEIRIPDFQRTNFSHIMLNVRMIENPISALCMLIQNSVQAGAKNVSVSLQQLQKVEKMVLDGLQIEEDLIYPSRLIQPIDQTNQQCIKIRDNGSGITPSRMKEVLTSFGNSGQDQIKVGQNEFQMQEHGVGLKLGALRLGKTAVIVTRCKNNISIGLLSQKFINDSGLPFLVAPVISYQLHEGDVFEPLTMHTTQIFGLIVKYCAPLFNSELQFKRYVINHVISDCTEIFVTHLRNPNNSIIQNELQICYQNEEEHDIVINESIIEQLGLPSAQNLFENSLVETVRYMFIQHPQDFTFQVNRKSYKPRNLYDQLYLQDESLFNGQQQKGFKLQLLKQPRDDLQGILVYRGNMFVRRLFEINSAQLGKRERADGTKKFAQNGIVLIFKKVSQTNLQKDDFVDRNRIRQVKAFLENK